MVAATADSSKATLLSHRVTHCISKLEKVQVAKMVRGPVVQTVPHRAPRHLTTAHQQQLAVVAVILMSVISQIH
jgi:hypothetical protein